MTATLTLTAALLLGLAASGHCLVMCGGISAALGVATSLFTAVTVTRYLVVLWLQGRPKALPI